MQSNQSTMEQAFHTNPNMNAALSPYISKFQRFVFQSVTLGDANIHPLTNSSYAVELLIVIARQNNAGTVQLWNENITATSGFQLAAADVWVQVIDNMIWEFSEALVKIVGTCGQVNPFKRQAIDVSQWKLQASAATQNVDICFGLGPNNE